MKAAIRMLIFLVFISIHGSASSSAPPNLLSEQSAVPVTLGQSVVALTGPWKFHIGDDPRWADPDFDDSRWETVDLTPTPQTTLRGVPIAGFVSGWTARGHAGYAGYAWYRMRVRISGADGPLAMLGPRWFDSGFQAFVNGRLVGSFGDFKRPVPEFYFDNPSIFSVPTSVYLPRPDGTTLIAFRFYMKTDELSLGGTGGMHGPPRLGLPAAAKAISDLEWDREYRRLASAVAAAIMYSFFALLTAMLFAFSRKDRLLLWPFAACVISTIYACLIFSTNVQWLSQQRLQALIDFALSSASFAWTLTWWAYFGLQRRRWLFNTIVAVGIIDLIQTEFFDFTLHAGSTSHRLMAAGLVRDFVVGAASFLLTVVIAFCGWKSAQRGKWPLYLALLCFSLPDFVPLLDFLHMRRNWQPFGVQLPFGLLCITGTLFFFSIVLFGQFRSSLQRQQAMEDEVNRAKEIQRLLIPEQMPQLSGWVIESEYHPAREVGGDFFQIIPDQHDGSLVIVAGDVTGKGLQAGMLVAMLVGAIRTESAHTSEPTRILAALNSRLHGREHAQATCLAIRIGAEGHAILANAGHLPPYLNGEPVDMEGSLPLGMIENAQPSVMEFQLSQNDRLVLVSDGIVEATDADGALFGFERLQALLRTARTVGEVASAAQNFGQEDDISVIAVTRTGAAVPALA